MIRLLCDVNDGNVSGGLQVMNNSYQLHMWWMTAELKVSLTFEVANGGRVKSNLGHASCCLFLFWFVGVLSVFKQTGKYTIIPVGAEPENHSQE